MSKILDGYVNWKGWDDDGFGRFDANHERYYSWHVHRAIAAKVDARVLEIGYGNGSFLGFCLARGFHISGIELDSGLRERAARRGIQVAPSVDALDAGKEFDLIALFDVLEHIPAIELISFMTSLSAHLAPGGSIVIRVPNGDSPFGRTFQHGDLTHVTAFGVAKLRQLAELAGLKIVAVGEPPWNAQQNEAPGIRAYVRAALRRCFDRLFGFAYYRYHFDLDKNLTTVLTLSSSPRIGVP